MILPVPATQLDMAAVFDYLADFKVRQCVAVSPTLPPRSPGGKLFKRQLRMDTDWAAAWR